jgi:hypothetical protein
MSSYSKMSDLQETTDYIQILLQGSGVDINYDNLRTELESGNGSVYSTLSPFKLSERRTLPLSLSSLSKTQQHELDIFLKGIAEDVKAVSDTRNQTLELVGKLQHRVMNLETDQSLQASSKLATSITPQPLIPNTKNADSSLHDIDRLLTQIDNLCAQNESLQSQLHNIAVEPQLNPNNDSQAELLKLKVVIGQLKNENDLLRLDLLSHPSDVKKHQLTRELIKRDKQNYKPGVSNDSQIIADIALQLGVKNIKHVKACIERICKAVKLIPQMRKVFIILIFSLLKILKIPLMEMV